MKRTFQIIVMAVLLLAGSHVFGQNKHTYVDLGLPSGTLWATCNVGANVPEEYGDYFAWGETYPKKVYNWSTYRYNDGAGVSKYSKSDGITVLMFSDDAASIRWDSDGRMPSYAEWEELFNNTDRTWTTRNGVKGMLFTASNGNSLFLPAAGGYWDDELRRAESYGKYWTSTLRTDLPDKAMACSFSSSGLTLLGEDRPGGLPVRPVRSAK